MTERVETVPQRLHPDRKLVSPLDDLRGGDFHVGTIISGAVLSNNLDILSGGGDLYSVVASSVIRVRLLNIEMFNNEPGWIEVEFRDGMWTGGRVAGPYHLLPLSRQAVPENELKGRYVTSGIFVAVLSGYAAQPLSNGIKVNVGVVHDPQDFYE